MWVEYKVAKPTTCCKLLANQHSTIKIKHYSNCSKFSFMFNFVKRTKSHNHVWVEGINNRVELSWPFPIPVSFAGFYFDWHWWPRLLTSLPQVNTNQRAADSRDIYGPKCAQLFPLSFADLLTLVKTATGYPNFSLPIHRGGQTFFKISRPLILADLPSCKICRPPSCKLANR
jgi:hypothetical protein